jgi:hypothetical protein
VRTEQRPEERNVTASPQPSSRPQRTGRMALRLIAMVAVLWFLGGPVGAVVGIVIALSLLFFRPLDAELSSRVLLLAAIVLLLAVPTVILLRGLPAPSGVSSLFVRGNMAAHYLAFAALAFLVIGILRDRTVDTAMDRPTVEVEPMASVVRRPDRHRPSFGFAIALVILAGASFSLRLVAGRSAVPDPVADRISDNMLAGAGYALPGAFGSAQPTALRMPGVPTLLWMAKTTSNPATTARVLWALLGAATVVLTGLAARRFLGRAAAIVAAVLVALLPSFWLQHVRLHSSAVMAFGVAVLLLLVSEPFDARLTFGWAAAAGAVVGLIGLTRPEGIVVAGLLLVAWLLAEGAAAPLRASRRSALAATAIGVMLVVYVPWLVRNQAQFHEWSPTTEVGAVAVGANGPSTYSGRLIGSYDPVAVGDATRRLVDPGASAGAVDRQLQTAGWRYAQDHSASLVPTALVRVLRAFELWSPGNERAAHAARGLVVRGWFVQWSSSLALFLVAGLGYWTLRTRRTGLVAPLFLAPIAVAATAMVSFGDPLSRSSIDPVFAIAAAAGLSALAGRLRSRRASG